MNIPLSKKLSFDWKVEKIGVIGPGIVGMPMASLLANARIKIGTIEPAKVVVIQRNSANSGWKVDAINKGNTVIGGIEPGLDRITNAIVKEGLLTASYDFNNLSDADMILVSIQTDKAGYAPDYGPLLGGLTSLAEALQKKPAHKVPVIVFESTLAPSSMSTVIKDHFAKYGLIEGKDILLGNSPNRVMPGRLVERVTDSDKLVAGLHPETSKMIKHVYKHIVTNGELHETNSMTAEVVKTLENAYRDVRIAFSTELVRYCDDHDIDFYSLREEINQRMMQTDKSTNDPNAVPSGGILIPMLGVGGHCLPKDGILLWWRRIETEHEFNYSLIINSRFINDESPEKTIALCEKDMYKVDGKRIAILGTAYRFNSEDTRNSPSLQLALALKKRGCDVVLHDPYVKKDDQNLQETNLTNDFTNDLKLALKDTDLVFMGTAHQEYIQKFNDILTNANKLEGVVDGCNVFRTEQFKDTSVKYTGIGRGTKAPDPAFIDFTYDSFRTMEIGMANEVRDICLFLNKIYVDNDFNMVHFKEVQRLAASCSTGCEIVNPGFLSEVPDFNGFKFRLAINAVASSKSKNRKKQKL